MRRHVLLKLFEFYHEGVFSLEKIVQKTSASVAKRYQIKNRGYIKEGFWADLVLVDLDKPCEVSEQSLYYKCKWSPFSGRKFSSSISLTMVNGNIVYDQGEVFNDIKGQALKFSR